METIAALSLACNVIQVVETGLKTAKFLKETYDKGSSQENKDLHDLSTRLSTATIDLQAAIQPLACSQSLTKDEAELLEIAKKCDRLANDLKQRAVPNTSARRRDRLKQSVKAYWNKDDVDEIRIRLERYQQTLHTRLLINMSIRRKIDGVENAQTLEEQHTLLEAAIERHLVGQTQEINRHTTSVVDAAFQAKQDADAQDAVVEQLKSSLRFPLMNKRMNEITNNYPSTFEWVFGSTSSPTSASYSISDNAGNSLIAIDDEDEDDEDIDSKGDWTDVEDDEDDEDDGDEQEQPDDANDAKVNRRGPLHRCDNFIDWLQRGSGPYWVTGKPGSGKSTLMKLLSGDKRTQEALNVWSSQQKVLTLKHFFWLAGDQSQRDLQRMLCSLLHQILDSDLSLETILPIVRAHAMLKSKLHPDDWSCDELKNVILQICMSSVHHVCFFIDGLDEMESSQPERDEKEDLLETVRLLSTLPNVKCCIASRPLHEFEIEFRTRPSLRMQDLNKHDIGQYVGDQLKLFEDKHGRPPEVEGSEFLVKRVTGAAEGVFLWAVLVVKDLRDGFRNGDTFRILLERINRYPSGLQSLYENIWHRINESSPTYRTQAALYFGLVRASLAFKYPWGENKLDYRSILTFAIASCHQGSLISFTEQSVDSIVSWCADIVNEVRTRCIGLLETRNTFDSYNLRDGFHVLDFYANHEVSFIHRSVLEFLDNVMDAPLASKTKYTNKTSEEFILLVASASLKLVTLGKELPFFLDLELFVGVTSKAVEESPLMIQEVTEKLKEFWEYAASQRQAQDTSFRPQLARAAELHPAHSTNPFVPASDDQVGFLREPLDSVSWITTCPRSGGHLDGLQRETIRWLLQYQPDLTIQFRSSTFGFHTPRSISSRFVLHFIPRTGVYKEANFPEVAHIQEVANLLLGQIAHLETTSLICICEVYPDRTVLNYFVSRGSIVRSEVIWMLVNDRFLYEALAILVDDLSVIDKFRHQGRSAMSQPFARPVVVGRKIKEVTYKDISSSSCSYVEFLRRQYCFKALEVDGYDFASFLLSSVLKQSTPRSWFSENSELRKWFEKAYAEGTEVDIVDHLHTEGILSGPDHPDILWEAPPMYADEEATVETSNEVEPEVDIIRRQSTFGGDEDEFVDAMSNLSFGAGESEGEE
ncbi:hypothetical protein H2198_004042 [Neophaeococcomyces mojaviensis]|uniref:Uncharacterized protein n=1 Tax=Neophaeococcomyces mojaviensis TaxID=3383035 RepID=A0ACC3A9Y5_9EURO|nr:hypothetical protein H2198_004042 [Knufia sp. JES_112]